MGKRKRVNWDYIEPLYRTSSLSNYEICDQYAAVHQNSKTWKPTVSEPAVRKQAKKASWLKDLSDKVKKQVKEKLVRNEVRSAHQEKPLTDEEIVEQVAEAGSKVVLRHRDEIKALLQYEDNLLGELTDEPTKTHISAYQGNVTETELGLTVKEKSATLKDLAAVRAQRIALERQAHDLDDQDDASKGPAKIVIKRKTRDGEE